MRKLLTLTAALLFGLASLGTNAGQKITSNGLDIHYIVFNSSFLQPEVASATGLERSQNVAVLNISPVRDGKGEKSTVTGTLTNLLSQSKALQFKEIDEGDAVYYIAQFAIDSREVLKFDIQLTDSNGHKHSLKFNQEVFPDP